MLTIQAIGVSLPSLGLLRALLIDSAVHSGPRRAVIWLQTEIRAETAGIFDKQTRVALLLLEPAEAFRGVLAERIGFISRVIAEDPAQAALAAGWMSRLSEWVRIKL